MFGFNCALVADYSKADARDTLSQTFNTAETLRGLAHTDLFFDEDLLMKLAAQEQGLLAYFPAGV